MWVKGVILCILIINQKRHDIFQTKVTQEAENLCRKREGCNINKFAIKVEKWVYIKDISKCVVSWKQIRSQETFFGSGRLNGPDKLHILHFECASNEIHISSTILRCWWWNWNFSTTTAALYSWLVTLSGPRSSILASYRETSVQPRQP